MTNVVTGSIVVNLSITVDISGHCQCCYLSSKFYFWIRFHLIRFHCFDF